ncbi:hypothetical protein ACIO3O_37090 [Streptomyces sp. NPDC087440]|uniref:hypothetical protein n=1 Tax=Streptomyces sp. NPDC087440 TaxID=3365790 RepID=UPI0038174C22
MSSTHKEYELSWGEADEAEATAEALATIDADREERYEQSQVNLVANKVAEAVEEARIGLDKIPDPIAPASDGDLTDEEEETRAKCDDGVDLLSTVFWIAGKSLDTMAVGRLFRRTPHKLEPTRCYKTIEEWAWVEKGIKVSRCSKLRAAWTLGKTLADRGYDAPEGQVRELVPFKNKHGMDAAVAVYEVVVQAVGADKVTAERLRKTVELLPGDLALKDDEDADQIARMLTGIIENAEPAELPAAPAGIPAAVRRNVDRRAIALADTLNRGRIPRTEVERHLLEAFADESDPTVFNAVLDRMKNAPKQ